MAADFETYIYNTDLGDKCAIRLAVTTAVAQPTAPGVTGADSPPVESRRSARRRTLQVRGFRMTRTTGGGVVKGTFLPILLLADYNSTAKGATITINGVAWTVLRKVPEVNSR